MAAAETARLIAELSLKDKMSSGINSASKSVDKFGARWDKVKGKVKTGLAVGGAFATGFIAANVKVGLDNLSQLESAVSSVDGAIKTMGLTGKITGQQIATTANEIEASIGAAFDDKDITRATATLIRFGKVTPANLKQAMTVMTDLAVRTGSVDSAATLLGKALADPTKAAGKLARQGIILTKGQQKQIAAFVKAGKVAEAQGVILDTLEKTTAGAAKTSQGPYKRAMSVFADVTEDAQKALAEGFLPVIEKVADKLSTGLADPKVMGNIREFGQGLARGLDNVISFAEKVPWGTIADGFRTAADWAGKLFDVFRSLPPEVQTTLVALAGLNKLSGGAISGVVGELGKGLVKGVLGMTAGVVNLKAGVVNGGGGVGAGAAGAAGKTGLSTLGKVALVGEAIGLVAAVVSVQQAVSSASSQQATELQTQTASFIASQPKTQDLKTGLAGVRQGITDLQSNPLNVLVQGDALDKLRGMESDLAGALRARENPSGDAADRRADAKAEDIAAKTAKVKDAVETSKAAQVAATNQAKTGISGAVGMMGGVVAGAVRASRPIVTTTVNVSVTAGTVQKATTVGSRYGPPNGSHGTRNRTGVE